MGYTQKPEGFQGLLNGRVALVTGASRGLGRAISLALGREGADVAATDLLLESDLPGSDAIADYSVLASHFTSSGNVKTEATADEIRQMGRRSLALKMDVTEPEQIEAVFEQVKADLGGVDIIINNAAIMENFALLEKQEQKFWERDIRVNLTGAFNCCQVAWPFIKAQNWGRIINISSFAAQSGAFAQPSYGASKAGLIGLTRSLALEGGRYNITVNAVLPGFIETEAVSLHDQKKLDHITERCPLKRLGKSEEVADLVVFLASSKADYITGAAIPITGGTELFGF